jgi:hypothetical protein
MAHPNLQKKNEMLAFLAVRRTRAAAAERRSGISEFEGPLEEGLALKYCLFGRVRSKVRPMATRGFAADSIT